MSDAVHVCSHCLSKLYPDFDAAGDLVCLGCHLEHEKREEHKALEPHPDQLTLELAG